MKGKLTDKRRLRNRTGLLRALSIVMRFKAVVWRVGPVLTNGLRMLSPRCLTRRSVGEARSGKGSRSVVPTGINIALAALTLWPTPSFASLDWETQRVSHVASAADEKAEVAFVFTNAGERPITIESVSTSCGCTTASLDKKTYESGESGQITAIFVFGDRVGKQRKRVTVRTNEIDEIGETIARETALELWVTIPEPVKVRPRLVYWRPGEDPTPKTVRITVDYDEPIHVTGATAEGGSVSVELKTLEAGKQYELVLTPTAVADTPADEEDAASASPPDSRSVVTIRTDFPRANPRSYTVLIRAIQPATRHATRPAAVRPPATADSDNSANP